MQFTSATQRGLFIVLEGGEGVGKTTQWRLLTEALLAAGRHEVVALREPGGTPTGDEVRRILLDPASELTPAAEALLFAASRAQLVRAVIVPALARGAVVLVDRFLLSTYAYQGAGRGLPVEALRAANNLATGAVVPDATLLLSMPLADSLHRMHQRGAVDRLEGEGVDFHTRVHQAFAQAADATWQSCHPEIGPVYQMDASGSPGQVTARCLRQLTECFPTRFAGVVDG